MLIYGLLAGAVVGVAAWQVAQTAPPAPDHSEELREPDGSWKYTNALIDTTSPYLLQHAHNPVDWYPWGEEALARAKKESKPIFLSVGYSTCYWCHVMEREVFENPEIAAMMNESFINVKVDREERPDLDEIYMTATQLMTQRGGWPNSVFLTPDLKPFFAGTYFGPEDRAGRPGFPTLVQSLSDAWTNQRADVVATADRAAAAIQQVLGERGADAGPIPLTLDISDNAVAGLARRFDNRLGGFGVAPKFPQGHTFPLLFGVHKRTGDRQTLDMSLFTLKMMAAGGMYDHVGGGFHRYSTDAQWRVPHFEKMLYNQAQLTRAYLGAHEATGEPFYADVARDVLRYVDDLMTGPEGQFYSALDAETDAAEGAYYVWDAAEVRGILAPEQYELFQKIFAFGNVPTFPGHKHPDGQVLCMRKPLPDLAEDLNRPYGVLRADIDAIMAALKERRDARKLPHLDDKVITGWNGLMIEAYADAGRVLGDTAYLDAAGRAADFVLREMRTSDGDLLRIWRAGDRGQEAFQEDYAFFVRGLTALHRATGDERWLDAAVDLADRADHLFHDDAGGGYFFASPAPDLLARSKSPSEGALPSGNAVMAHALLDLAELTGDVRWRARAEEVLSTFSGSVARSPASYASMALAMERLVTQGEGAGDTGPAPDADPTSQIGSGPAVDSSDRVRMFARVDEDAVRPGEPFTVRVRMKVDRGWHINANPASLPELIPTTMDVRSDAPITVEQIAYPDPDKFETQFSDAPLDVYDGILNLTARVRLDPASTSLNQVPMRILVRYQACDEGSCLAPAEQILDVSVPVSQK